jgi:hypothetical protein
MTPVTSKPGTPAVIKTWAGSGAMVKQVAARLAREIALRPPNEEFQSSMRIAANYGISNSMAVHARRFLASAGLVYKQGRRYYTGQPEGVNPRPRTGE